MTINKTEQSLNISTNFHFRKLGLKASNIASIMNKVTQTNKLKPVHSISFSYNPLLGDSGVISILNTMPKTIREIGLVDCGMTDLAGKELLKELQEYTNLKMLCIEQNNISDKIKKEFKLFSKKNPGILVLF
jgi:hypothetical protein